MKPSFIIVLYWFFSSFLYGQDIPEPMSPPRLVNDFAGIFSTSERNDLEQMLRAYDDSTSTQLYIVTIKDLGGYDVSDYTTRLGEKWGVGTKGKDNGAVILIKPRTGNERGRVFIATGYGLEPVLTDARIGRIIDEKMIPYFSRNDYYTGTKSAVITIIGYLSGQFTADEEQQPGDDSGRWIIAVIIFIVIILYAYLRNKNGGNGNNSSGGFPPIFPTTTGRGFGSSGGGGNVFRGGGGGRFGGGGAGRSW